MGSQQEDLKALQNLHCSVDFSFFVPLIRNITGFLHELVLIHFALLAIPHR
jgi:hypothetical protein